jgi:hypothetical protein
MGITVRSAAFAESVPTLDRIIAQLSRATGLQVATDLFDQSDLFLFHAKLWFECCPRERITVYAYSPEQLRAFNRRMASKRGAPGVAAAAAKDPKIARILDAWDSQASSDASLNDVHIRGFVGEEGTLHGAVALALESLGGDIRPPLPAFRREECSMALTPVILRERHRRHQREWIRELLRVPKYLVTSVWRRFTAR